MFVAGGLALAGVLLRPSRPLFAKSGGPADNTGIVLLVVLACLGGFLMLTARYRASLAQQPHLSAVEQRLSDATWVVLAAAALLIPLMLAVMHRFPSGDAGPPPDRDELDLSPGDDSLPPAHAKPPGSPDHGGSLSLPHWLLYVGVAALVLVVLLAGYQLWRHLRPGTARPDPGGFGHVPDEQDVLAEAVDSGRRALLDGDDPRAAVIACYAAMEASLAGSGVARRASDSPQDLLERAFDGGLLSGPHAEDLTRLFREARYSTHPMDTGHRDRAAAALDAIAAQLAARAAEQAGRAQQAGPAEAAAAPQAGPAQPAGPGRTPPTTGAQR